MSLISSRWGIPGLGVSMIVSSLLTMGPVAAAPADTGYAAFAWGGNGSGRLGIGVTDPDASSPTPMVDGANAAGTWVAASAGFSVTCGMAPDASAYCWGDNTHGALGNGTSGTSDDSVPMLVGGGITWKSISAGGYAQNHVCGVAVDGQAYCWGFNGSGQLGNGTSGTTDDSLPGLVSGGLQWASISAGGGHTCGITTSRAAYCWGLNQNGQLGDDSLVDKSTPVAVAGGRQWASIFAGREWTCGIDTGGRAYCWGDNSNGQLGDGTNNRSTTPSAVANGANGSGRWTTMDLGYDFTCGVGADRGAYCWGGNFYGQLGNGTRQTSDDSLPVLADMPPGESVREIGTGVDSEFVCATTDDSVYCWGSDASGALGNPAAASPQTTPFAIAPTWQLPGMGPRALAVGGMSSMLLVGAAPAPDPTPTPPTPASPPRSVTASPADASAAVAWQAPATTGSFPVTNYLVTASPGGRICLTTGLSCTVAGLSNGTAYTFTVQALTGAGWSAASLPSDAVTPVAPVRPSITITGTREGKRISVEGTTTGMGMGAILRPWVRISTAGAFEQGKVDVLVSMEGTFDWERRMRPSRALAVYFTGGDARSNTLVFPRN